MRDNVTIYMINTHKYMSNFLNNNINNVGINFLCYSFPCTYRFDVKALLYERSIIVKKMVTSLIQLLV